MADDIENRATTAMRTPSGAPSAAAREQHGGAHGEFPVFDHKSAHSALMLRGHAPDPSKIIAKVRAWANEHGDKAILAECDAAAEKDRSSKRSAEDLEVEVETRSLVETRSDGVHIDGINIPERIITVLAVPYDQPTRVPFQHEMWDEVFSRSAFNGIENQTRKIPATASLQIPAPDHEGARLVGRVISSDPYHEAGLVSEVKISRTDEGDATLALAEDEALFPSIGFMVKNPRFDQELDRYRKVRRVNRAFLDHLAFVGQPAYQGAKVLSMRADDPGALDTDSPIYSPTPRMDAFLSDPILQWAAERVRQV